MPRKLSGTGPQAIEWNAMVDYLTSLRPIPSSGGTMEHTTFGVVRRSNLAQPGAIHSATRFRVQSVQGNYLTCKRVEGTGQLGVDVIIAKPLLLRHNIPLLTINGIDVSFSDYSISGGMCYRKASATGYPDQHEYVLPLWQFGDVYADVWAMRSDNTGVPDCGWIDLNVDGRAWCMVDL